MAQWLNEFKILKDSYKEDLPDFLLRSNMDVGPAKIRKRTVATPYKITFSMLLTTDVFQTFKMFYKTNGALVFDFNDPMTNEPLKARFDQVPSMTMNETLCSVSVVLEIMP